MDRVSALFCVFLKNFKPSSIFGIQFCRKNIFESNLDEFGLHKWGIMVTLFRENFSVSETYSAVRGAEPRSWCGIRGYGFKKEFNA